MYIERHSSGGSFRRSESFFPVIAECYLLNGIGGFAHPWLMHTEVIIGKSEHPSVVVGFFPEDRTGSAGERTVKCGFLFFRKNAQLTGAEIAHVHGHHIRYAHGSGIVALTIGKYVQIGNRQIDEELLRLSKMSVCFSRKTGNHIHANAAVGHALFDAHNAASVQIRAVASAHAF